MASVLSFASLVEAITRSVAEAQDSVERHQVQNLLNYFDKDGRPRGIEFRVPSRRADAAPGEEDFYSVPLLALISINVLKIKDINIKFSVDMGEITEEPERAHATEVSTASKPEQGTGEKSAAATKAGLARPMKTLQVSTATGTAGGKVRVVLRVRGSEPSEGAARLLDYLAQMQGTYPEIVESAPEKPADREGT